MKAYDLISERRGVIRDFASHLLVPTGHLFMEVELLPLKALLDEINQPGRFPPGIRATVNHLVLRATARALTAHAAFNDFYLHCGDVQHNEAVVLRVPLDADGHLGFSVVSDAAHRPFDELVVDAAARSIEDSVLARRKAGKLVRMRKLRPLFFRLASGGVISPMYWLRDHVAGMERSTAKKAVRKAGTFVVSNVGSLGVVGVSSTLLTAAVADLFVCAPVHRGGHDGPMLPVGVSYDLRLFEAWEAAAFLREVLENLRQPETLLN